MLNLGSAQGAYQSIIKRHSGLAMRKLLASLAITMGAVGTAHAQADLQADADAAAGRELAQTCAACHGQQGISAVGTFPNLETTLHIPKMREVFQTVAVSPWKNLPRVLARQMASKLHNSICVSPKSHAGPQ